MNSCQSELSHCFCHFYQRVAL